MDILINSRYKIIDKIAQGSFGYVYRAINIRTNEYVAIKVEKIADKLMLLKNETIIYNYLKNEPGIPAVKWYGKDDKNYYMVLELLGKSLQHLKNESGTFSLKMVLQTGIQMLDLLKSLHAKGLVHRDIKPDNILIGTTNENYKERHLYLVDFGLCKPFVERDSGTHIVLKKTAGMIGTSNYASINAHNHFELSRRDDLESMFYVLTYLLVGTHEWQNVSKERIKDLKMNINANTTLPIELLEFRNCVRDLDFDEMPDYDYLNHLLTKNL